MRFLSSLAASAALALAVPVVSFGASGCGASDTQRKAGAADASTTGGSTGSGGASSGGAASGGASSGGGAAAGGRTASGGATSTGGVGPDGGVGGVATLDGGQADAADGAGSLSCADFAPGQPGPSPTSVRLVNNTAGNIYLGSTVTTCDFVLGITVEDSHGSPLTLVGGACDFTCTELQQQGCICPPTCNVPLVTLLAPGKYKEVPWTGTVFATKKMPATCFEDQNCDKRTCLVEESAPAGALTVKASAYTAATCSNGPCTDCTPGSLGTCTIQNGQTVTGTEIKGSAVWTGQNVLQISLQ